MKNTFLNSLPKKLAPGDTLEVQLSPYGVFPGRSGSGERRSQLCDAAAFGAVVRNFEGPVPVDFDHAGENGGSSEAAAWVESVRADPERGLVALFRFTDRGAEAVSNRRYRFLSPCWTLSADGRPDRLVSVGLTNRPNLPVEPMLNSAGGAGATAAFSPDNQPQGQDMEKTLQALGLPPDATDDAAAEAVAALQARIAELEAAKNEAEAEKFAEDNKDKCGNSAVLKEAFLKDRELAAKLVANMGAPAPAAPAQKVLNSAAAAKPPLPGQRRAEYDALHGQAKLDYLAAHRAEIEA